MYVFSTNAKTTKAFDDFSAGDEVPFIVYINFKDMYGAEQLCHLYLTHSGFTDVVIKKRKLIEERFLNNQKLVDADTSLREAINTGYSIQVFNAH